VSEMKLPALTCFALSICAAAALLAGCGGSQPPIGWQNALPQSPATAAHAEHGGSWMLPGAKKGDLLYITGGCGGTCVLSYPVGKLVGSLSAGFDGLCSDKNGDVFLTNGPNVLEYAHGGTSPIQTLSLPAIFTIACSVDTTTGDLAVTFDCSSSCGPGPAVGVFQDARGIAQIYADSDLDMYYCGYDKKSNLFIDGFNGQQFGFAELPRGSNVFTNITLDKNVGNPGQVQWDGKYVTVEGGEGAQSAAIYRVEVSRSTGRVVGTTRLGGLRRNAENSWIQDSMVVVPYARPHGEHSNRVGLWKYPAGGRVTNVLKDIGHPANFSGVTVSVAPMH
jgi:hypothetical protein